MTSMLSNVNNISSLVSNGNNLMHDHTMHNVPTNYNSNSLCTNTMVNPTIVNQNTIMI